MTERIFGEVKTETTKGSLRDPSVDRSMTIGHLARQPCDWKGKPIGLGVIMLQFDPVARLLGGQLPHVYTLKATVHICTSR